MDDITVSFLHMHVMVPGHKNVKKEDMCLCDPSCVPPLPAVGVPVHSASAGVCGGVHSPLQHVRGVSEERGTRLLESCGPVETEGTSRLRLVHTSTESIQLLIQLVVRVW